MKLRHILLGLAATTIAVSPALAHRQWMLPSATTLSGDDVWVTVDAAISNDLFYFEHQPMRLNNVKAYAPDGSEVQIQNGNTGRYRSTFDVQLSQRGTYKIASVGSGIMGSFTVNGAEQRLPRGTSADQIGSAIPAGATNIRLTESLSRNEIFVTSGAPTTTVFTPSNRGLELVPVTHPNDLVAGEAAQFKFVIDGQPAANIEVHLVPGGKRYREQLNDQTLRTNAQGEVTINFADPGYYWINATASDDRTTIPNATQRRLSYITTVEVMAP